MSLRDSEDDMMAKISIALLFFLVFFGLIGHENVLADEAIPFTEQGGLKYVTVQINGVPMNLVFDTGSNKVVLNSDALQRLGIIADFSTARKFQSYTAGGVVESYILTLNSVKVGNVERYNYEIAYVPSSTENLLGASFFANYSYYIDEDNSVIRLIPKGSFVFDRLVEPPPPDERQRTGSGLIEVEIDGKKYIYGKGWQDSEHREKTVGSKQ